MHGLRFEETAGILSTLPENPQPQEKDHARAVFEKEIAEKTEHLHGLTTASRFREAVFLSNPVSFPYIERWFADKVKNGSRQRSGVLTSSLYLQRFCLKNDTASFFGPTFWGRVDPASPYVIEVRHKPGADIKRHVFFTHWAAEALADWASQFPSADRTIRPRRVPTVRLQDGKIEGVMPTLPRWQSLADSVTLPAGASDVWTLMDGARTITDVIGEAERRWQMEPGTVREAIRALAESGLIHAKLEIPTGIYEPVGYLEQELEQGGVTEALAVTKRLQDIRRNFEQAGLSERVALLEQANVLFGITTESTASRGAGKMYADRSLIYEEAAKQYEQFTLGMPLREDLEILAHLIDLLRIVVERDRERMDRVTAEWFQRRFLGRPIVSFLEYAAAFIADADEIEAELSVAREEMEQLAEAVYHKLVPPEKAGSAGVKLTPSQVESIIRTFGGVGADGVISNPDIMIAASSPAALEAGDYKVVLGELHAVRDLLTQSPAGFFLPEDERDRLRSFVAQRYAEAVQPDEVVVDIIRTHRSKTSCTLILEGLDVEAQGRSSKERDQVLQMADLQVHYTGGTIRLYAPTLQRYLRLVGMCVPIGHDERTSLLRPFSFPHQDEVLPLPGGIAYNPRVEVGRVVLLRRSWRAHYQDWRCEKAESQPGWSFDLMLHMNRLRSALDLPERVFVKVHGERKGTYLDFGNYFLVHAFYKVWREHHGMATFSEMCPDIGENWLQDGAGHYSFEQRTGFYRKRETTAAAWGEGQ